MNELEVKKLWDNKAEEWDKHIGQNGDKNRIFNSDPVLWKFLGNVKNKVVLDAGCGTGYLSIKLYKEGAKVIGIDLSPKMIKISKIRAYKNNAKIDFKIDTCCGLNSISNNAIDIVVSNYVLMDLPNLDSAVNSFFRVLKKNGKAILIFLHPCFSVPGGPERLDDGSIRYKWEFSYFKETYFKDKWGNFSSNFMEYHRPLNVYWKSFKKAGFRVEDFEEPVISDGIIDEKKTNYYKMSPYSVAFLLKK